MGRHVPEQSMLGKAVVIAFGHDKRRRPGFVFYEIETRRSFGHFGRVSEKDAGRVVERLKKWLGLPHTDVDLIELVGGTSFEFVSKVMHLELGLSIASLDLQSFYLGLMGDQIPDNAMSYNGTPIEQAKRLAALFQQLMQINGLSVDLCRRAEILGDWKKRAVRLAQRL